MRYLLQFIILFLLFASFASGEERFFDLGSAHQLAIVITDSWEASEGTLYSLAKRDGKWQFALPPRLVVVGKGGLGWGVGQAPGLEGPRKKEGDGKAPAGLFPLGKLMGYSPSAPSGMLLPYRAITSETRCVDDSQSALYNRIVEQEQGIRPSWTSAEKMLRHDDLYRWLIVVYYNDSPPQPEKGSCIFLHVWRAQGKGTAGCTAMPEQHLLNLAGWIDPTQSPHLLQLPRAVFEQLPEFAALRKAMR